MTDIWAPSFSVYSKWEWVLRLYVGPLLLVGVCPLFVNVAALAVLEANGSIVHLLSERPLVDVLTSAFVFPTERSVKYVVSFAIFELALLVFLPGREFLGPISPSGEQPVHCKNGDKAFIITFACFAGLSGLGMIDPAIAYDELLAIMTTLNMSALFLAAFLFIKGLYFPSTKDHGGPEPYIFRFYEGEELYPNLFGVDMKNYVITRIGMMSWAVFTVSFSVASYRAHGGEFTYPLLGSAILNFSYVAKFFLLYEEAYLQAGDIAVDRFGFMLAWGTVAFMPLVHNLHTLQLVQQPGAMLYSASQVVAWVVMGYGLIFLNYDSDTQKYKVRQARGKLKVWGKDCEFIRAKYVTADGVEHESILVTSGYQGISRHFHYLPDIILLFMYCSPAGFDCLLPHTYFVYLTGLLLDRTVRLDRRCQKKYGKFWDQYCRKVPYRLIPGLF